MVTLACCHMNSTQQQAQQASTSHSVQDVHCQCICYKCAYALHPCPREPHSQLKESRHGRRKETTSLHTLMRGQFKQKQSSQGHRTSPTVTHNSSRQNVLQSNPSSLPHRTHTSPPCALHILLQRLLRCTVLRQVSVLALAPALSPKGFSFLLPSPVYLSKRDCFALPLPFLFPDFYLWIAKMEDIFLVQCSDIPGRITNHVIESHFSKVMRRCRGPVAPCGTSTTGYTLRFQIKPQVMKEKRIPNNVSSPSHEAGTHGWSGHASDRITQLRWIRILIVVHISLQFHRKSKICFTPFQTFQTKTNKNKQK